MGVSLESPVSASGPPAAVASLVRVFLKFSELQFFLIYKMDAREHLPPVTEGIIWDNA